MARLGENVQNTGMYLDLALLAGCALLFGCIAGRVERSWLSGPILFVLFGVAVGPLGLGWLSFEADAETLKVLAELTLALVLFTDAAGIDLRALRKDPSVPVRMLLIGLPLTLLAGYGAGVALLGELSWLEIALLATLLAPTDAALGQAVVKNQSVPPVLRRGLNVESGLNDGICVPVLLVFLTLAAGGAGSGWSRDLALTLLAEELGIGLLVGVVLVLLACLMMRFADAHDWWTPDWKRVPMVALALACFAVAQHLHGSGFIAAFCGGLLFGHLLKGRHEDVVYAAEGVGDALSLVTWVLFGSAVVGSMTRLTLPIIGYALLSLTLVRMLPVFLSLAGTAITSEGRWFLGWFGPRGLASIVFAAMVIDADLPNGSTVTTAAALTILLSIALHGMTANPWARRWEK